MTKIVTLCATLIVAASFPQRANAGSFDFTFAGPGVSGTIDLTYGTATDSKYPQALEVTGISGTFSDSNNGLNIVDASITSLEAIKHDTPEKSNKLAPNDFSRFAVKSGLPADGHGFLTYDNLYYPNGSPATATDYPLHGGFLDIYGLLFDIGGGRVVDLWSNGNPTGTAPFDYGVAVATKDIALDYVGGGAAITPEPGALALLGAGLAALAVWRRRTRTALP